MIKIKNGSIIELNMPQDNEIESLEQEIRTEQDNNRYVVMGYQGNGITIVPLEDYKNKIFKLTGAFAPLNRILNEFKFGKA